MPWHPGQSSCSPTTRRRQDRTIIQSGIHAQVVNGHSPARLRSVIHLAQARSQTEHLRRNELVDVSQRFAGRKLVDQAESILMGTRQLRDNEAYRVLRSTAMGAKQRIGQVTQQIITQAHYAEAISRAGQMRMLSQRCMKLYALIVLGARHRNGRSSRR